MMEVHKTVQYRNVITVFWMQNYVVSNIFHDPYVFKHSLQCNTCYYGSCNMATVKLKISSMKKVHEHVCD